MVENLHVYIHNSFMFSFSNCLLLFRICGLYSFYKFIRLLSLLELMADLSVSQFCVVGTTVKHHDITVLI